MLPRLADVQEYELLPAVPHLLYGMDVDFCGQGKWSAHGDFRRYDCKLQSVHCQLRFAIRNLHPGLRLDGVTVHPATHLAPWPPVNPPPLATSPSTSSAACGPRATRRCGREAACGIKSWGSHRRITTLPPRPGPS